MKAPILAFMLLFIFSCSTHLAAQSSELKDTYIVDFSLSEGKVVIDFNGTEMEIEVNDKTKYKKKKKKLDSTAIVEGTNVNIKYKLENGKRVVTEIYVLSEVASLKNDISGKLEFVDGDIAFIDGRKVKISNGAVIKCNKKKACGCSGMMYPSFDDPFLAIGSFMEASGQTDGVGVLQANKLTTCQNKFTKEEKELSELIENNYNGEKMHKLSSRGVTSGFKLYDNLYNGEIKIGEYAYQLVNDIKVQGYINQVGFGLIPDYVKAVPDSDPSKLNFRFFVINDPVPNAFAFPNGMVFIHTGLLEIIDNESQLALVLGHEIAHITHEHGIARYKKSKQANFGSKLAGELKDRIWKNRRKKGKGDLIDISPKVEGMVINNLQKVRPSILSSLYQKDKENQADRVGLLYAYQAGYDLREAPKFWQKMKNLAGDESFMGGLATNAESMFLNNQLNNSGNLLDDLGAVGTSLLVNQVLETVFTSHPKAIARYNNINLIIKANYGEEDFDQAEIGVQAYMEFLGMYKQ